MQAWMRTALLVFALGFAATIGSIAALGLTSQRGSLGPTILQANTPVLAASLTVLVLIVTTVLGIVTAKATTAASGMFVVGFGLFTMAMRTDGVTEFVFSDSSSTLLVFEAVFMSLCLLISSLAMFRFGGLLQDVPQNEKGAYAYPFALKNILSVVLLSLAMLPVVWVVAVTPTKGQAIGSAFVGGVIVAVLARKYTPHLQPILYYAIPTAVAAIGYAVAATMGITDIGFTQNTISTLIFPMPIDYAAGSIMGVSVGLSWGASLAQKVTDRNPKQKSV
jgi:hypothetical protein